MRAEAVWASRKLLRAARCATLATSDLGQPFASLITPATAPDLSILLLLSDLSAHTRHLRVEPRCAILVTGAAPEPNPQTAPRVTVTGVAEITEDAALRSRYLALHPYAAMYANFGDFHLWRVRLTGVGYVGGFARAARLSAAELSPDSQAVTAILTAESEIISHCNQDHPDALARIAGTHGGWQMVTVDVDGCDLAQNEHVLRIPWSSPVSDSAGVRRELVALSSASSG